MKITQNFDLDEFTYSQTAVRKGIKNTPNAVVKSNIIALAENVMQPLRTRIGRSISITSGFRCNKLNLAVGGSGTSQHVTGEACDFQVGNLGQLKDTVATLINSGIEFDQLILERFDHGNAAWAHVSFKREGGNRNQILTYYGRGYAAVTRKRALEICGRGASGEAGENGTEGKTGATPVRMESEGMPFDDTRERQKEELTNKINKAFGLGD